MKLKDLLETIDLIQENINVILDRNSESITVPMDMLGFLDNYTVGQVSCDQDVIVIRVYL